METKVISSEDFKKLHEYFENEQDEIIEDVTGKTMLEAADIIGPKGYEEETLQHILVVLFPDKYEAYY